MVFGRFSQDIPGNKVPEGHIALSVALLDNHNATILIISNAVLGISITVSDIKDAAMQSYWVFVGVVWGKMRCITR